MKRVPMSPAGLRGILLVMTVVLSGAACGVAPAHPVADLIVTNAKIWTGNPAHPDAEALAVVGDRVVTVGRTRDSDAWRGAATRVIDAGGRRVVPGFNDAHVHFVDGGIQLDGVKLKDAASPEEFARRIGERAKATPAGEWIQGGEWDDQGWTPAQLPTKAWIDPLTPETPVFVSRYDGHMALANSRALQLAQVTARTPDPPGGVIIRDGRGEPTGVLKDAAMGLVDRVSPPVSPARRERGIRRALAHAASLGVTSVQDMNPSFADIAAYAAFAERGDLTARVYAAPMETSYDRLARIGIRHAFGTPWLRLGAVKGYADGSLGSTTAFFFQPYTDAPGTSGLLSDEMQSIPQMRERLVAADAAGLQLCIHAIGDRGISTVLDLFGDVVSANGPRDRRFRIEHAQHVAPADFDRFTRLDVIASVQPYHAIDDGRWAERRIGPERIRTTYAFRRFLDRRVRLAFGTDWTVAPLDPMLTLYAAVSRATLDGKHPEGWVPDQKLSIEEALRAYTSGSAYAEFQDQEKGTLAPGRLADLVVLSEDLLTVRPERIKDVRVVLTVVGGKIVFEKTGAPR